MTASFLPEPDKENVPTNTTITKTEIKRDIKQEGGDSNFGLSELNMTTVKRECTASESGRTMKRLCRRT